MTAKASSQAVSLPPALTVKELADLLNVSAIEVIKRLRDMSPLYELAKEGVDLKSIKWKAE